MLLNYMSSTVTLIYKKSRSAARFDFATTMTQKTIYCFAFHLILMDLAQVKPLRQHWVDIGHTCASVSRPRESRGIFFCTRARAPPRVSVRTQTKKSTTKYPKKYTSVQNIQKVQKHKSTKVHEKHESTKVAKYPSTQVPMYPSTKVQKCEHIVIRYQVRTLCLKPKKDSYHINTHQYHTNLEPSWRREDQTRTTGNATKKRGSEANVNSEGG